MDLDLLKKSTIATLTATIYSNLYKDKTISLDDCIDIAKEIVNKIYNETI